MSLKKQYENLLALYNADMINNTNLSNENFKNCIDFRISVVEELLEGLETNVS